MAALEAIPPLPEEHPGAYLATTQARYGRTLWTLHYQGLALLICTLVAIDESLATR